MSIIEKNWLIRTKQHQILGPISKVKIIELLEKNSLLDDDELSSGNGYWFLVGEKDLLDKYIYGDIVQSFNPISEAESVLTVPSEKTSITSSIKPSTYPSRKEEKFSQRVEKENERSDRDKDILPDEDDLAYPDLSEVHCDCDDSQSQHTMVIEIPKDFSNSPQEKEFTISREDDPNSFFPDEQDLEYPEIESASQPKATQNNLNIEGNDGITQCEEDGLCHQDDKSLKEISRDEINLNVEEMIPDKNNKKMKNEKLKASSKGLNKKNYTLFIMIVLSFVAIVYGIHYYYTKILNKPFPIFGLKSVNSVSLSIISNSYANEELKSLSKKKTPTIWPRCQHDLVSYI